jgi:heme exporter protein C
MAARESNVRLFIALAVTAVGFVALPFMIAPLPIPVAADGGLMSGAQKIFYFHVPCCWSMMICSFIAAGASVRFLFRGTPRSDRLALSASELGAVFGVCALISGPMWGRVEWGHYWTWDARQTSTLLLWLMLLAYLLARKYGGPAARGLAAALSLFAAADVPLVYGSVYVWRTMHPSSTVVPKLDPALRPAFYTSALIFFILLGVLLALRLRLERARGELAELQLAIEDAEEAARP